MVKNLPAMQGTRVQSPGGEESLEKEMETYSSILASEILWTEESGGLQSKGSQRVGHNLVTKPPPHVHYRQAEALLYCCLHSGTQAGTFQFPRQSSERVFCCRFLLKVSSQK